MGFEQVPTVRLERDPATGARRRLAGASRVVARCNGCGRPCGPHDDEAHARAAALGVAWALDETTGLFYCAGCAALEPRPHWPPPTPEELAAAALRAQRAEDDAHAALEQQLADDVGDDGDEEHDVDGDPDAGDEDLAERIPDVSHVAGGAAEERAGAAHASPAAAAKPKRKRGRGKHKKVTPGGAS